MRRTIALIDGEHYPPVVRAALQSFAGRYDIVGAAFIGGTEKIDTGGVSAAYGIPVVTEGGDPAVALAIAIDRFAPEVALDLSDEPVITAADRLGLANVALGLGVDYEGADFSFRAPRVLYRPTTPTLSIIGTGKRVGKTSVSAHVARILKASGRDIVVLAMGRGGPAEPELLRGDEVALGTDDLLAFAAQGKHAASDNYEDAVMSRVTTVGCRRCGGGLAGDVAYSNVAEGARLADSLGKELMILEGSGAAIPPVASDGTLLVVGAGRGVPYVRDYFGPYRLGRADAVLLAGAEEPLATPAEIAELTAVIRDRRPDVPVLRVTFRPRPLEDITGARVFYATTAGPGLIGVLSRHLEVEHRCEVVAVSAHLSDRARLRADLARAEGRYDVLLTELKAAAIDVVAAMGARDGVRTVLCDNEPRPVDGGDLTGLVHSVVETCQERQRRRSS